MSDNHSNFVWFDLMTTDARAAETFYGAVVGWTAKDSGVPGAGYTMFSMCETQVAGVMGVPAEMESGARPIWLGYLGVDDLDAATESMTGAGGRAHQPPTDIPGIGRFAPCSDPQGAAFMLFEPGPGSVSPPNRMTEPGQIGWHELNTSDWQAAWSFYAGQFGWAKDEALDMGAMGTYQLFSAGKGNAIGGMMTQTGDDASPPHWLFYFNVPELGKAEAEIRARGGQVLYGPADVPGGGFMLQALDPQGARFALAAPKI